MRRVMLSIAILCALTVAGLAQQPPASAPAFEVASVRPNKSGTPNAVPPSRANGSYSASNVALKSVIANAYEVRIFQIAGDPAWVTTERFDIIARGREGTPDRLRPAMLRTLLAERFKLVAHFETREQQVYALVLARSDAKLGPRLKPAAPGNNPDIPLTAGGPGGARIVGKAVSMDDFARELATQFRQVLTNRTGLNERFELDLQYTPDSSTATAPEFPSIFTAVQEQLGLKLEASRGPVEVLVIDSVERPTPD